MRTGRNSARKDQPWIAFECYWFREQIENCWVG